MRRAVAVGVMLTRRMIKKPKFKVGQIVNLQAVGNFPREGPFKVETVARSSENTFKYTLCEVETSVTAKGGTTFSEGALELAVYP